MHKETNNWKNLKINPRPVARRRDNETDSFGQRLDTEEEEQSVHVLLSRQLLWPCIIPVAPAPVSKFKCSFSDKMYERDYGRPILKPLLMRFALAQNVKD